MQSGVKLELYVKCRGGEEVCEKLGLSPGHSFFFVFFVFFCNQGLFVSRNKKPYAALAMKRK